MLLPQILSFFKFYPYCGSSKTEVLCTYFRQRKVPYQKKNRPFSSDVFCQKVRTVSTVATGFIRYWICILKFFLHNVKNLKLLLAFSYTFMHKEITFYIYRSICRLDGVMIFRATELFVPVPPNAEGRVLRCCWGRCWRRCTCRRWRRIFSKGLLSTD